MWFRRAGATFCAKTTLLASPHTHTRPRAPTPTHPSPPVDEARREVRREERALPGWVAGAAESERRYFVEKKRAFTFVEIPNMSGPVIIGCPKWGQLGAFSTKYQLELTALGITLPTLATNSSMPFSSQVLRLTNEIYLDGSEDLVERHAAGDPLGLPDVGRPIAGVVKGNPTQPNRPL